MEAATRSRDCEALHAEVSLFSQKIVKLLCVSVEYFTTIASKTMSELPMPMKTLFQDILRPLNPRRAGEVQIGLHVFSSRPCEDFLGSSFVYLFSNTCSVCPIP